MPAKIAYAVDKRNQRWMKQNESATDREEEVDDTLLEFEDVTEDALNDRLSVRLPKAFKEVPNNGGNPTGEERRGRKIKMSLESTDPNMVVNKNPVPEFVATDEEKNRFSELFGGKNVCHRVDWSGRGKCAQGGTQRSTASRTV